VKPNIIFGVQASDEVLMVLWVSSAMGEKKCEVGRLTAKLRDKGAHDASLDGIRE